MQTGYVTRTQLLMRLMLFVVIIPCFSFAQTSDSTNEKGEPDYQNLIPQKDGVYMYEDVKKVDSATKDELYTRAKVWFVQNFKDAKEVLQMDDRAAGRIIGKGFFAFDYPYFLQTHTMRVFFTADITVKDGKYRIQFYDIDPQDGDMNLSTKLIEYNSEKIPNMITYTNRSGIKKMYKRKLISVNAGFLANIQSINTALAKQTTNTSNTDF